MDAIEQRSCVAAAAETNGPPLRLT
jgi:hypothetical protein